MTSETHDPARRAMLHGGLLAAALAATSSPAPAQARPASGGAAGAGDLGLRPGSPDDQSAALQRALALTARAGQALLLPPGRIRAAGVTLPPGARLVGEGSAILVQADDRPVLQMAGGGALTLQGFAVQGRPDASPSTPLVSLADVERVQIDGLAVQGARGVALRLERCGGRVERNTLTDADVAVFSLDARPGGLVILGNHIEACGNNGIQVWRSAKDYDGSQVLANHIRAVRARSGGSGENGNGVNVFRAGGVIVAENTVQDCTFSAVRNNAGDNVQILGNSCTQLGEVAIFAEFGFEGCLIANNLVDRASVGLSITNFDHGGRLAVASGNLLRNLFRRPDALTGVIGQGIGIAVEADASVTGNVIEGAEFAGISIGYGPYLRDVLCSGNVARRCRVGIAVSAVERASGLAQISNNLLSHCPGGGIVGFEWDKPVTGDLTAPAARRFAHVAATGNSLR